MSVQSQIDELTAAPQGLGGLPLDRSMLGIALRMGTEGGKRFRPWLFAAVHDVLAARPGHARADQQTLDRVAASIELLHTAFVVHDDVIDNDDTRRGHASVPGWFRGSTTATSSEYPRAGAILTGDLALAAAVRGMATCGAAATTVERLLDLLDATLHDSAVGELADVRLALGQASPDLDDALAVAELKTAAYSFVLPMKAAAVLAGVDDDTLVTVEEIGRRLGIAFQLRDDLIGTFASADELGKDPDGDLREGKRTPLVVHASGTSRWRLIEPLLGRPDLTRAQADVVRRALVESGSVHFVEQLLARHVRAARLAADRLELTRPVVDVLTASWQVDASSMTTAGASSAATAGVA